MPEERSIFSRLKPINIDEEKEENPSRFQEASSQKLSSLSDVSIKNDIVFLKEKISSIEKAISELSKTQLSLTPSQVREEILLAIKGVINEEFLKIFSALDKSVEQIIVNSVSSLKSEIMKMVDEEIKSSIDKNLWVIESLKNISSEDFKKLEDMSIKLDFIAKLYDKIESFEKMSEWLDDMTSEFNKITQNIQNIFVSFKSEMLDEISKNIEKITYDKLSEIKNGLISRFDGVENSIKQELTKNTASVSNDLHLILKETDDLSKCVSHISTMVKKITEVQAEMIEKELKSLEVTFRDLKNKLLSEEELKNLVSIKKYSGVMIDIEARIKRIESIIASIIKKS
ncbi:MAG: hypothetical protein ACP5PA_07285 [Elusimicrobiales bacterium]